MALVLAAIRLAQKSSLTHVLGAVFATAIAAFFAVRSGRAEAAFLPGILTNAGFLVATLVSILTRWPAVGFLVGAGDPRAQEDPFAWRRDRGMVRVCSRLTWVLVGTYAVRLSIMVPLYLAAEVAWLGAAKIAPRLAAVGGVHRAHGVAPARRAHAVGARRGAGRRARRRVLSLPPCRSALPEQAFPRRPRGDRWVAFC